MLPFVSDDAVAQAVDTLKQADASTANRVDLFSQIKTMLWSPDIDAALEIGAELQP